eukprot:Blabericola_migrator_1__1007@NODE_1254_length_4974_cov_113_661300_g647_i1_p1_GENE_NODE_1254_length_4974_cov_113_661300_g647_i1NODE_1254_length_4974_cov_113_661300_g647_i1_p1_ORF_typecomplete_len284_score35_26NAD_binding_1/PF00175_21/8_8e29FAD_binding_6/PF00970_24/1_2e11FAD_binding_6/PF00970_24/3_4e03NAD_binding_6/PF08030_12/0_00014_NODE_1254_length_4974_cov_113_661300_g647_i126523503
MTQPAKVQTVHRRTPSVHQRYSESIQFFLETGMFSSAEYRLIKSEVLTHDTKRLTYEITPDVEGAPRKVPEYPVTSCALLMMSNDKVKRPYTPTDQTETSLEFIIKGYPTGKLSQRLVDQTVGDSIVIQGPVPELPYEANKYKKVGMLCVGTGIAPMYQVLRKILSNPEDNTEIILLYGSRHEEDIILRDEVEQMAREHANRMKLYLYLSKPDENYRGLTGRINKAEVEKYLGPAQPGTMVLVCGTPDMVKDMAGTVGPKQEQGVLEGALKELGYTEETVFKF